MTYLLHKNGELPVRETNSSWLPHFYPVHLVDNSCLQQHTTSVTGDDKTKKPNGHWVFSLTSTGCQLKCVLWQQQNLWADTSYLLNTETQLSNFILIFASNLWLEYSLSIYFCVSALFVLLTNTLMVTSGLESESEVTQWSHSVVSDSLRPVDCSPPSSSVHGILQARILEWVAISFSRGSSRPRDQTHYLILQADALTSAPPGSQ